MSPIPAVFLDRDETLIANTGDLGDPNQVQLLPGVTEGVKALHAAGWMLIVITNQGGVARGRFRTEDVDAVHAKVQHLLATHTGIDAPIRHFYSCPWHPDGTVPEWTREHPWRKPQPGMLLAAAQDYDIDLDASWMVGDTARDIEAGQASGCRTILLGPAVANPTHHCDDLMQAAAHIGTASARSKD